MTSTRQDYALIRPRHIREAMQHVLKESGLRVGLAVGMDIVLSGREFLTALGELPDRIDAILETTTLNAEQKKSVRGALPDFEAAKALMEEGGASAQAVRQLEEIDLDMRAKLRPLIRTGIQAGLDFTHFRLAFDHIRDNSDLPPEKVEQFYAFLDEASYAQHIAAAAGRQQESPLRQAITLAGKTLQSLLPKREVEPSRLPVFLAPTHSRKELMSLAEAVTDAVYASGMVEQLYKALAEGKSAPAGFDGVLADAFYTHFPKESYGELYKVSTSLRLHVQEAVATQQRQEGTGTTNYDHVRGYFGQLAAYYAAMLDISRQFNAHAQPTMADMAEAEAKRINAHARLTDRYLARAYDPALSPAPTPYRDLLIDGVATSRVMLVSTPMFAQAPFPTRPGETSPQTMYDEQIGNRMYAIFPGGSSLNNGWTNAFIALEHVGITPTNIFAVATSALMADSEPAELRDFYWEKIAAARKQEIEKAWETAESPTTTPDVVEGLSALFRQARNHIVGQLRGEPLATREVRQPHYGSYLYALMLSSVHDDFHCIAAPIVNNPHATWKVEPGSEDIFRETIVSRLAASGEGNEVVAKAARELGQNPEQPAAWLGAQMQTREGLQELMGTLAIRKLLSAHLMEPIYDYFRGTQFRFYEVDNAKIKGGSVKGIFRYPGTSFVFEKLDSYELNALLLKRNQWRDVFNGDAERLWREERNQRALDEGRPELFVERKPDSYYLARGAKAKANIQNLIFKDLVLLADIHEAMLEGGVEPEYAGRVQGYFMQESLRRILPILDPRDLDAVVERFEKERPGYAFLLEDDSQPGSYRRVTLREYAIERERGFHGTLHALETVPFVLPDGETREYAPEALLAYYGDCLRPLSAKEAINFLTGERYVPINPTFEPEHLPNALATLEKFVRTTLPREERDRAISTIAFAKTALERVDLALLTQGEGQGYTLDDAVLAALSNLAEMVQGMQGEALDALCRRELDAGTSYVLQRLGSVSRYVEYALYQHHHQGRDTGDYWLRQAERQDADMARGA